MPYYDYHVHSTFSDGKHTLSQIAEAACEKGIRVLGFSDHSPFSFPSSFAMTEEKIERYREEVIVLRRQYQSRMQILCGIELDIECPLDASAFDYRIGSVHCLRLGEKYWDVDMSPKQTRRMIDDYFDHDPYRYAEAYFARVADLSYRSDIDIIGHVDLLSKFEEKEPVFDQADFRYRRAWMEALEALLPLGKPFEINTGAISRGWRTTPYPSSEILTFLRERGATIMLNSDSHNKDTLCFRFDLAREIARACGFTSRVILTEHGAEEIAL